MPGCLLLLECCCWQLGLVCLLVLGLLDGLFVRFVCSFGFCSHACWLNPLRGTSFVMHCLMLVTCSHLNRLSFAGWSFLSRDLVITVTNLYHFFRASFVLILPLRVQCSLFHPTPTTDNRKTRWNRESKGARLESHPPTNKIVRKLRRNSAHNCST